MNNIEARGWYFTGADKPLEKRPFSVMEPRADEAVVAIAGCGLCHTDIGFISGKVKTNAELPLILGHEISGSVIAAGGAFEKPL